MSGHDARMAPHFSMLMLCISIQRGAYPVLLGDGVPVTSIAMRKIKDVLRLKLKAQLSHERIASSLGISKSVVARYFGACATAASGAA
jgi:hypothetical protein